MAKYILHFRLSEEGTNLCEKINERISGYAQNYIRFGTYSNITPHITILAGNDYNGESSIAQHKELFIQTIKEIAIPSKIDIVFTHFEFHEDKEGNVFTFLCLKKQKILDKIRNRYYNKVNNKYLSINNFQLVHFPHVTISYTSQAIYNIKKELFGLIDAEKIFKIETICLSYAYPKGTCDKKPLWSIPLI